MLCISHHTNLPKSHCSRLNIPPLQATLLDVHTCSQARVLVFLSQSRRSLRRLSNAVASLLREGLGESYKDLSVLGRSRLCGLLPSNPVWSSEGVLHLSVVLPSSSLDPI